jgi:predicted XRE-type DNA-binding protein
LAFGEVLIHLLTCRRPARPEERQIKMAKKFKKLTKEQIQKAEFVSKKAHKSHNLTSRELKLLKRYYSEQVYKQLIEDGLSDLRKRACELKAHVRTDWGRQYEAFQYDREGIPQNIIAEIMGISQPAVNKLLRKYYEKYPSCRMPGERVKSRPYGGRNPLSIGDMDI